MNTLDLMREYLHNDSVTLTSLNEVRLESTGQTLGQVLIGRDEITEHLKTNTEENGNEWHGVESGDLYSDDAKHILGVTYLGDDVWYQSY